MRRHLENLRSQHPSVRSRVALMAAFSVTGLVALVWLTTLPVRFDEMPNGGSTTAAIAAAGSALSPQTQTLQDSFRNLGSAPTTGVEVVENPKSIESAPAAEEEGNYPAPTYNSY